MFKQPDAASYTYYLLFCLFGNGGKRYSAVADGFAKRLFRMAYIFFDNDEIVIGASRLGVETQTVAAIALRVVSYFEMLYLMRTEKFFGESV